MQTMLNYYEEKFNMHMGNSKKQWETINSVVGESKNQHRHYCVRDEFNTLQTDKVVVSNMFNKFFASVPKQLSGVIDKVVCSVQEEYGMKFSNHTESTTCFFSPVDEYEILSLIRGLKNTESTGYDGISNRTVKETAFNIIKPMEFIFNMCLLHGVFPAQLKRSLVLPLFKKGDVSDMSNFRPISLLSVFSKILEKIIKIRFINFLNRTNFISSSQYGFRPKLNTEDALLHYFNDIYTNLNMNRKVGGLFIDVTKAFDTVNHALLLQKLFRAGFRGIPFDILKSYLSSRPQSVKINGCLSNTEYIDCGVPQGSVLGPILFLVYVNSLCNFKFNGNVVAFADDTAFSYQADTWMSILLKIKNDLYTLQKWFSIHSMILSSKTRFMPFVMRNQIDDIPNVITIHSIHCVTNLCNINCVKIEKVHIFRYLGLVIDTNLDFEEHAKKLFKHMKSL